MPSVLRELLKKITYQNLFVEENYPSSKKILSKSIYYFLFTSPIETNSLRQKQNIPLPNHYYVKFDILYRDERKCNPHRDLCCLAVAVSQFCF